MSSICPNHNGPLCTTCKLGGLIRCPIMGVPLPLVEHEKPRVVRNSAFNVRVWPPKGEQGDGVELKSTGLSEYDMQRIYQYLRDQGYYE